MEPLLEVEAQDLMVGDVVYVEGTGYEVGAIQEFPEQNAVLLYISEHGGPVKMAKLINSAKVRCSEARRVWLDGDTRIVVQEDLSTDHGPDGQA